MLTTNSKLAEKYNYLDPKFEKGVRVFAHGSLVYTPLGNTPIDGDEVFANVQAYTTLSDADAPFESQQKYFDLQFIRLRRGTLRLRAARSLQARNGLRC